ncbi:MAG TPA: HAD-IA family hydrolase [Anaerolineales bacterium]|nr:HAD-IA family hydrolase [Anaerolineales bacterium]
MNQPNDIKAIFFDLDGTLRHSVPSGGEVFTDYVKTLGLAVDADANLRAMRWEHFYWANSQDLRNDLLAHSAETENFWIEYSRRRLIALGASEEWAREFAPRTSIHMGDVYKPDSIVPEDVRRTLPQLKEAGYILAVISNRDKPFQDLLEDHGISQFFDFSLAAGEVNVWKPEPGIFKHGLQRVNLPASEVVYVGDNYYADVVGARSAGLQPVLYDPLGIFPDPDCVTIQSLDDLITIVRAA